MLSIIGGFVELLLTLYVLVLIARLVLDYIPLFNREWRPKGAGLVIAEAIYVITDPPIRFFRRLVPPLRLGPVALDLAWSLAMLLVIVAMTVVSWLSQLTALAA